MPLGLLRSNVLYPLVLEFSNTKDALVWSRFLTVNRLVWCWLQHMALLLLDS